MKIIQAFLVVLMLFVSTTLDAQEKTSGFDSVMRSSGRIYVVIAVMLTILFGLILYIVRLDRKISKMEKEV